MRRGVVRARWRRSLQLRVVSTTLLISTAVVLLLGIVLLDAVMRGLLDSKTEAARNEALTGLDTARDVVGAADRTDETGLTKLLDAIVDTLSQSRGVAGEHELVILATGANGRSTGDVDPASLPPRLIREVRAGKQASTYLRIRYGDGATQPGFVVGGPLAVDERRSFQLFYLFPLVQEQDTLSLVRRAITLTGGALVLLLFAIALLVTRQVVKPVRAASRGAQRLAHGHLEERLPERGDDELARLASSFNTMADALQRQIARLEELSSMQQRFVADVSHELRTPLTTVRMAADVLHGSRSSFDPAVARSAELLYTQIDRFESLLADLLEISRHDAGVAVLEAEPADLRAVVRRVVDAAAPLAERQNGVIEADLPAEPVIAEVDTRRVERILRNLVDNAIQHGEDRPVQVCLRADDGAVAVTVRDFGVGLHPGEATLVFNRFWRADPARARGAGGTGLGLSIALEDARLHGGWLQAWGEPGAGSQFRLTLPRTARGSLGGSPLPLAPEDRDAGVVHHG